MFLRKHRMLWGGEVYEYWTSCETVRTERGRASEWYARTPLEDLCGKHLF